MRALTRYITSPSAYSSLCRNEVEAREGIDTKSKQQLNTILHMSVEMRLKPVRALTHTQKFFKSHVAVRGRNEVEAREGIDTIRLPHSLLRECFCRNEVEAREGIDTFPFLQTISKESLSVEMRLKPVRALTLYWT